jgi:dTDP-4-amino-4,6-dideoxygalactose transaminase
MRVPLLDLSAQFAPIRDEVLAAIARVCDSQQFILGAEVEACERELAAMLEVRHAIGVSSGTDALLIAMMALDIGPGDEVITPTYSFFATAGCVARLGARPVFVDVERDTLNLDPAATASAITARTRAIVPVHLFGQSADMEALGTIARERGLAVIEDAAQAIGARYKGRLVGGLGIAGCFSFFPSKNLGAFGDAGLVTTNDDELARKMRLLRTHGMHPRYYHHIIGGNFRIDALQAAVLRVKIPYLAGWTEGRRRNADRYRALFAEAGLSRVELPVARPDCDHIYNQFVIRVPDRDALRAHLTQAGIGNEVYYPVPFHRQACFAHLVDPSANFPVADEAAATSLALPIYGELTEAQQRHVVQTIAAFYRR